MIRILIVEDEKPISNLIRLSLTKAGYHCTCVYDGNAAVDKLDREIIDLILLDIMLPGANGFELMDYIRPLGIPVIFLTAVNSVNNRVRGLKMGAEDYIIKPFETKELVARVKAVLRRYHLPQTTVAPSENARCVTYPDLIVNLDNYSVTYDKKAVEMPPKELELLYFLASAPNQVFTREQLLDNIWGYDYIGDTRTVDVHIKRIREKIKDHDKWSIETVWGIGYKFVTK